MNKEQLRQILTETICHVTFEKTDGTIRHMDATLMKIYLPKTDPKESLMPKTKRDENPDVLAVWDTEKDDWRSFRVGSVKEVVIMYPLEREGLFYAASTQE